MQKYRLGMSTAVLALIAGQAAQAQSVFDLDEIVFSANLVPTEQRRTGASVSVVTEEDLEAAGDMEVAGFLSRLPGVMVVQEGALGQQASLRIRGSNPRYVAVYIDGIRVDDPTGIATEFNFGHMTTADISRIEVLRGTQSAMFGGSAVAGVVNITSHRAQEEGFSQSFEVEAGSYNTYAGRYTLGFRDARFESAFTLSHLRTDGYSAYDTLPKDPTLAPDGFESTRLSFSARYQATDELALGGSAFIQYAESDYDDWGADAANRQHRSELGLRAFAEYAIGATDHELSVTHYRVQRDMFSPGMARYVGTRTGVAYQGTTVVNPSLTLVYGADTMLEVATTPTQGPNQSRISGVFGQLLWAPNEAFDLSATARYDHNSEFGGFFSGRVGVAWQASEALTLRGAVAQGFRAPSFFERHGEPMFSIDPNPGLTPERSQSAEIGLDYRLSGGAQLSATAFYTGIDNMIDYVWGVPAQYQNVPGLSPRSGVELAAEVPLGDRFSLAANYTYTNALRADGTRQSRVPRHDMGLALNAQVTDRLQGSLALQHVADRPDDFGTVMPDYSVVNLNLRYALTASTDVTFRVHNLLNEQYQQAAGYGTAERSFYVGLAARF